MKIHLILIAFLFATQLLNAQNGAFKAHKTELIKRLQKQEAQLQNNNYTLDSVVQTNGLAKHAFFYDQYGRDTLFAN